MTKVLVIDDQRIAREYMENIVQNSTNYELAGSLSKADLAETVCQRSKVDLVLMDVCTHGRKDGIDAAAELRIHFPKLNYHRLKPVGCCGLKATFGRLKVACRLKPVSLRLKSPESTTEVAIAPLL